VVQDDSRQLERLLAENRDHFRSQTYSSVAAVPPLPILDSLTVDEPNLLPVCDSEVVKSGEYDNGQIRQDSLCSGKNNARNENAGKNNDDIIRTHAAEENNARIFEVQVIKGALGLGFCIEGGRGSATGDRPVAVKRLFKGILHPPRRLCFHLCLSVRLSVNGKIFTKFYGMVGHNAGTNRLDFGSYRDLDLDPGITVAVLSMVKAPHRGFDNCSKNAHASGPQIEHIKAALAEVCTVRVLLVLSF